MFPEGIASDTIVQKILYYQMRTVEMMMKKVADAIKEANLPDAHPLDFLAFFCLGNREAPIIQSPSQASSDSTESSSEASSFREPQRVPLRQRGDEYPKRPRSKAPSSSRPSNMSRRLSSFRRKGPRTGDEEILGLTRRHPIYQHAKLFIADDELLVTGSANLNERSMCGVRDTEIAFSAFQPSHRFDASAPGSPQLPRGEVGRFRRRVWAEHVLGEYHSAYEGTFPEVLEDPGTTECMRELHRVARRNWADYLSPQVRNMRSHLLPYPYEVDADGNVSALVAEFPDTRGNVLGTMSGVIPDLLVS